MSRLSSSNPFADLPAASVVWQNARVSGPAMRLLVLFTLILVCLGVLPAYADKRVALVIGNGSYRNVSALPNPANDANDIAASFGRLGFSVTKVTDGTFDNMRRALLQFGRDARGSAMAVVFFAGHGMEIGGENWLIPVDAELASDTDAENEAVSLRTVMLQVAGASSLGLVILDACRDNPFAAKMQRTIRTRAVDRGLVRTEPTDNVLVAYAAKDGTLAQDGDGRNSPFSAALLRNLETPGLEITFLFRNVRDEVMAATKREQEPFVYGSLSRQAIYLKEAAAAEIKVPPEPVIPTIDPCAAAGDHWRSAEVMGTLAAYEDHLTRFPNCAYAGLARARIEELEKKVASPPTGSDADTRHLATPSETTPGNLDSYSLNYWPKNSLKRGQTVTAKTPLGLLTCTSVGRGQPRNCSLR